MIYLLFFLLSFNDAEKCIDLIYRQNIKSAYELYQKVPNTNSEEKKFLDMYFSRDAAEAVKYYERVYKSSNNRKMRVLAKKKLYEFYYTKGLYQRAESYNAKIKQAEKSEKRQRIFLQCGVFTAESNAIALKAKLKELTNKDIELMNYRKNGKLLIRVLISKFKNIAEAEKLSGIIHQKLLINSIIKTDIK